MVGLKSGCRKVAAESNDCFPWSDSMVRDSEGRLAIQAVRDKKRWVKRQKVSWAATYEGRGGTVVRVVGRSGDGQARGK